MRDTKKRILCVEDHPDSAELVHLLLNQGGYTAHCAQTVADALDVAARKRFDLYLVDIRLPDGTGFDFCRRLREFDPETPVLFYSASSDKVSREEATRCGAQGYLAKPVTPEALEEAISEILR